MGLSIAPAGDVWSIAENLWSALTLARTVRLQGEKDARDRVNGGKAPLARVYNVDSEDYQGG